MRETLKNEEIAKNKMRYMGAFDILEKADDNKNFVEEKKNNNEFKFWSFFNPFKPFF